MTVLDQLDSLQASHNADAEQRYWEVVRDLAAGASPLPEVVLASANAIGRTAADVRRDVTRHQNRERDRQLYLARADRQATMTAAADRISAIVAARQKVIDDTQAELEAQQAAYAAAERAYARGTAARAELIKGCDQPQLRAREQELHARRLALAAELRPIQLELDESQGGSAVSTLSFRQNELAEVRRRGCHRLVAELEPIVGQLQARVQHWQGMLADVKARQAALEAEYDQLCEEMALS